MRLRRIISTEIDREGEGLDLRAAVNAVVAVNVNEPEEVSGEQEVRKEPKEVPDE